VGTALSKKVKTAELFDCETAYLSDLFSSCNYPWELLPRIKGYALGLIDRGIEGYTCISEGVLVGENVKIHPSATVQPPAVIGSGTEIRPGAFLRGCVITGKNCVIGNSSELKNCILLDGVQVPHFNYVGDSVLGNFAHMGASAICSNLKGDGSAVTVHGDREYETGLRKLGAILGDGANVGCSCVLNPGTVIGRGTVVYPNVSVRGVIEEQSIVKSMDCIVKKI
jgi:NDP-sugar pyrophosphorylase family protein